MEWLAGEKTQVVGTFPPKKKGWTGYVEKDTAGQTNIYSVEVCCLKLSYEFLIAEHIHGFHGITVASVDIFQENYAELILIRR